MAVITIGTTGVIFGLTAETGMLVQTVGAKTHREKAEVKNNTGDTVSVSYFNPTQNYTIAAVLTGAITNASPGLALTVANTVTNGVTTGGIYVDDVDVQMTNTDVKKISINATRYPEIA